MRDPFLRVLKISMVVGAILELALGLASIGVGIYVLITSTRLPGFGWVFIAIGALLMLHPLWQLLTLDRP